MRHGMTYVIVYVTVAHKRALQYQLCYLATFNDKINVILAELIIIHSALNCMPLSHPFSH